jgi:regulator of replication initiation timing
MDSKTKSKLTGGTFLLIVIIVVIFGNIGARHLEEQLSETHKAVLSNGKEIQKLRSELKILREENTKLSQQLSKNRE